MMESWEDIVIMTGQNVRVSKPAGILFGDN